MRLLLHIGTEKTGSSFLQTLAARNRERLLRGGILYPLPKRRRSDLLEGRVSPGNGALLKNLLERGRPDKIKKFLLEMEKRSRREGANAILLSNERLLEELACEETLQLLLHCCAKAQISSVDVMLVLRDPVEQCLSLYRHRSKHGSTVALQPWLNTSFKLPGYLRALYVSLDRNSVRTTVIRYSSEGTTMLDKFFNQWLKQDFRGVESIFVNRSLTLSEIELMRTARNTQPALVPLLFSQLDAIDPCQKANHAEREDWARTTVQRSIFLQKDAWSIWNDRLPAEDQMSLPSRPGNPEAEPPDIVLSEAQTEAVFRVIRHASTPTFRCGLVLARIRRVLSRLVRRYGA